MAKRALGKSELSQSPLQPSGHQGEASAPPYQLITKSLSTLRKIEAGAHAFAREAIKHALERGVVENGSKTLRSLIAEKNRVEAIYNSAALLTEVSNQPSPSNALLCEAKVEIDHVLSNDFRVFSSIIKLLNIRNYSKFMPSEEKFRLLELYATQFGGQGIRAYHALLFPELHEAAALEFPSEAPFLWKSDRQPSDTPPEFIRRVYSPWLGKGLSRAHLRSLDKPLWQALYNWLRHNEMPADIDLPTRVEQNDRIAARLLEKGSDAELPTTATLRDARRLEGLVQRRRGKEKTHNA